MAKFTNITTVFTNLKNAEERQYGNVLKLDPPMQDPELTKRFADAIEKYPSNFLKHRNSDENIRACFNAEGQFEHVKTSSLDISHTTPVQAPGALGVFGKRAQPSYQPATAPVQANTSSNSFKK